MKKYSLSFFAVSAILVSNGLIAQDYNMPRYDYPTTTIQGNQLPSAPKPPPNEGQQQQQPTQYQGQPVNPGGQVFQGGQSTTPTEYNLQQNPPTYRPAPTVSPTSPRTQSLPGNPSSDQNQYRYNNQRYMERREQ